LTEEGDETEDDEESRESEEDEWLLGDKRIMS
jgi:hypothetical protein